MYCILVGTAYPLRGGIAHYNALLASSLATRHKVETITFKRQYPAFLFPGTTQEETGAGLHANPAPRLVDSINPLNWVSVGRLLRQRKPDLLIFKYWLPFFGPCFGTIAKLVKRNRHTKVLFICDNVLPHEQRPFDKAFTRYAFRHVDYFIVQSDAVERELAAFWPGAITRNVPHPVYNTFGSLVDKHEARRALGLSGDRILLFFGYIRKYKGLDVLLEAMPEVLRHTDVRLLVVGEFYDDESRYRSIVEQHGLAGRVLFHSAYLPNERVGLYFSAADAVVLPYRSATQSGIAQIAYNFNRPVLATDVGGLSEVVHDGVTGYVVPPDRPGALSDAILKFYNESREEEFSRNVRREKQKYSWDNLVNAIEEFAAQTTNLSHPE
jgi:glycosyltransferase involved in cell wall biosynthesis